MVEIEDFEKSIADRQTRWAEVVKVERSCDPSLVGQQSWISPYDAPSNCGLSWRTTACCTHIRCVKNGGVGCRRASTDELSHAAPVERWGVEKDGGESIMQRMRVVLQKRTHIP